jgi:hypothetical protein
MTNGTTGPKWYWILAAVAVVAAFIIFGVILYNMNSNMAVMDKNGRELTAWATRTAKWTTHVNEFHLRQMHQDSGLAPDHIPPPQDPPPDW